MGKEIGKWTHGGDEEVFRGGIFETREAAIKDGKEYYAGDGSFFIGQIKPPESFVSVDVDSIFEHINEQGRSECGEVAEDYLCNVKQQHADELEQEIADVIQKWIKTHGYEPEFYGIDMNTVEEIEPYQVGKETEV